MASDISSSPRIKPRSFPQLTGLFPPSRVSSIRLLISLHAKTHPGRRLSRLMSPRTRPSDRFAGVLVTANSDQAIRARSFRVRPGLSQRITYLVLRQSERSSLRPPSLGLPRPPPTLFYSVSHTHSTLPLSPLPSSLPLSLSHARPRPTLGSDPFQAHRGISSRLAPRPEDRAPVRSSSFGCFFPTLAARPDPDTRVPVSQV